MSTDDAGAGSRPPLLPLRFRRLSLGERRAALEGVFGAEEAEREATYCTPALAELADVMVESAVGSLPVPLGVATGYVVDGEELAVPLATEEPSVVAASSFAARLVAQVGGFTSWAAEPVMTAHVYLEGVSAEREERLRLVEAELESALAGCLRSMRGRGGGFRGMGVLRLPETGLVRVEIRVDVRDAMGANLLNTAAERARPLLEAESGGRALMCILSNSARHRLAGARFAMPVGNLGFVAPTGVPAPELARRVALASEAAREDPERAVTHNKGIMNGISALALATGNDTRALEAAAHAWACRDGRCRGLSRFTLVAGAAGPELRGEIELPLPLGSLGGSVGFHPASSFSLRLLGRPSAARLARIAASCGLAQNLAALLALTGEGIQKGHMRLHAARLAWRAGARGDEIPRLAALLASGLAERGSMDSGEAARLLEELRRPGGARR